MSADQSKSAKTWTILDIVNWATSYFQEKNIESPRLKIELILCHLLKINRVEVYSKFDRPLSPVELDTLRNMVKRVANHEPIQYIIGKVQFCDIELNVNESVLIPRPETEQLVQIILEKYNNKTGLNILDIGSGSGCIGLTLAKNNPLSSVVCIDKSEAAIEVAKSNVEKNSIENVTFLSLDVSMSLKVDKFDIIVSNPPYIEIEEYNKLDAEVLNYEPRISLTDEGNGLKFYGIFAEKFRYILKDSGEFFLEFGFGQRESLEEIFESSIYKIKFENDFSGLPRFLIGSLK